MAEKIFTSKELRQIESLAERRGYKTPRDYVRALLKRDAEQHGESLALDDELSPEALRDGIREGLREALRGEYVTLETLWSDDDE